MQDDLLLRYSRQVMLPEFDYDGQQALVSSKALILGLGGLGSPAALYLAAAGVGELWLVDDDQVELSNLQRQIIHSETSVGQDKVASAKESLLRLNHHTAVHTWNQRLPEDSLTELIMKADVVLDCTDNFSSRFLTNRICMKTGTPLVSAAAIRWEGQMLIVNPRSENMPCYACLYGEGGDQSQSCSETGIMSPVVGMMGVWQALEAIKLLSGVGPEMAGLLSVFDGLRGQWRQLKVPKNPNCECCGNNELAE